MIPHTRIPIVLLAMCMFSAPLFAESLLVTVAYTASTDTLSIKHAEIMPGAAPAASGSGNLILAYEFSGKPYSVTRFYMPTANPLDENDEYGGDIEQTLLIPWESRAGAVAVYGLNNTNYATLALAGLKNAGDAIGTPPKESTAFAKGEKSVSKAVNDAMDGTVANAPGTGSGVGVNKQGQQNKSGTGSGGCFPAALIAIAAFAVLIKR